jgi:hypothetical protein
VVGLQIILELLGGDPELIRELIESVVLVVLLYLLCLSEPALVKPFNRLLPLGVPLILYDTLYHLPCRLITLLHLNLILFCPLHSLMYVLKSLPHQRLPMPLLTI